MRIAIIGNNDGPERLRLALEAAGHTVVFTGLQKPPTVNYRKDWELTPNESTVVEQLEGRDFELLINCFANFRYRTLLELYRCWNVHLAPLPRYRGRHPLQWALIEGETTFGVTIHEMNAAFDDGAILWQSQIEVESGWSAAELREALMVTVEGGIGEAVSAFENGKLVPSPNVAAEGSYLPRRSLADSLMTHDETYDHLRAWRKIRALRHDANPARVSVGEEEITIVDAHIGWREPGPGEIEMLWGDDVTLILKIKKI